MTIAEGQKIPDVTIKTVDMKDITTSEIFAGKRVVLFAVPGAFTPTCSAKHLPGYVEKAEKGDIPLDVFITHNMPLEDINEAFELMHEGKSIRSVIHF